MARFINLRNLMGGLVLTAGMLVGGTSRSHGLLSTALHLEDGYRLRDRGKGLCRTRCEVRPLRPGLPG